MVLRYLLVVLNAIARLEVSDGKFDKYVFLCAQQDASKMIAILEDLIHWSERRKSMPIAALYLMARLKVLVGRC